MYLEVIATILGLIQGILIMLNKRSNWIFYILQMVFLIVFSAINHLYGDVLNNSFYLILGFIGFIQWHKDKNSGKISLASHTERIIYVIFIIFGTMILNMILKIVLLLMIFVIF